MNSTLSSILEELKHLQLEGWLGGMAVMLLIVSLFTEKKNVAQAIFIITTLGGIFINSIATTATTTILHHSISLSQSSHDFIFIFLVISTLLPLFKRSQKGVFEFYFLILSILLGAVLLSQSNSLLVIYLAVELISLASYILTNFSFKKEASEASIKFMLIGVTSSAIMIFGIALVYGSGASMYIHQWDVTLLQSGFFVAGIMLFILSLFFKIAIVPMHIWVPATYQTAPCDVVTFLVVVPKIATLLVLSHLFHGVDIYQSFWLLSTCLILGIGTIVVGTLGGLTQQNVRRLLGFGAIAHSGFLLPFAILDSAQAFWWYAAIYSLMNFAVFYIVEQYESNGVFSLSEYKGLGQNNWKMGVFLTIVIISLIGLPPTSGFTAKLFLVTSLVDAHGSTDWLIFVTYALVVVLATLLSLFLYLRLPINLYLHKVKEAKVLIFSKSVEFISLLVCFILLLFFFIPNLLFELLKIFTTSHQ